MLAALRDAMRAARAADRTGAVGAWRRGGERPARSGLCGGVTHSRRRRAYALWHTRMPGASQAAEMARGEPGEGI